MRRLLTGISVVCVLALVGLSASAVSQTRRGVQGASRSAGSPAGKAEIKGLRIDNIGISDRVFRMSDNGDLMLDQAGMHLEVTMSLASTGLGGQRVICALMPLSADGYTLRDNMGDLISMRAVTPASGSASSEVKIPIPYGWVIREGEKVQTISFSAMVMYPAAEENSLLAEQTINIDPSQININKQDLPGHMLGQLFGGGSGKSSKGGMGSLLGGLFGGPSATSTHDCSACDGEGLCQHCDGDGFFNPAVCRKCSKDPGVCRRCGGAGTEEVEVELHESLF
ncbi:MAG: hypothetical protein K2I45_02925 [Muribaculaceae bacterium]|nr:hypothetical protein [Muribaculaceae bacterium]